uniref:Uncharacterized protein n=1 Tax=Eptatretus burgeri TaxID=7764 RepID=A0A8C4WWW9_EPTBU
MPGTSQIMRLTTPQRDEGNGTQETIHGRDERDNESIKDLMNTVAEFRTRRRSKNELWTEAQAEYEERAIPLNYHKLTQLIEKTVYLFHVLFPNRFSFQDLYFPMNPDSESRSDMEVPDVEDGCRKRKFFRLLSSLASAANYIRLSNKAVAFALTQHHRLDGPQVCLLILHTIHLFVCQQVIISNFTLFCIYFINSSFFALSLILIPVSHRRVFARVMIFASITHGRTILKAFKDMPCTALDHTLPHVYPRVSILDRTLLTISLGVGGLAVFVNVYMVLMSDLKLTLTLLLFAGVLGARALAAYRRRRATHLLGLSRMLYYKNTSNNADLLTALAFRAHEQHLKEAMLVVALLLQNPAEGRFVLVISFF